MSQLDQKYVRRVDTATGVFTSTSLRTRVDFIRNDLHPVVVLNRDDPGAFFEWEGYRHLRQRGAASAPQFPAVLPFEAHG